jgi:hypothetical protein
MLHNVEIPRYVIDALHDVEEQLPADCYEPETVITFIKLFQFDDAYLWLNGHRDLYFEALARVELPPLFPHR